MKILVVGQGGREHALVWKLKNTGAAARIYCAPGNAGTGKIASNVAVKPDDINGLCSFCEREKIDLTLVGPEAPLAMGVVDLFEKKGLRIFGPSVAGARLEASKVFMKELCREAGIPTARGEIFDDAKKAGDYVRRKGAPLVVKADGLAAGKGVIIAATEEEALDAIESIMLKKEFGASGDRLVVEECLEGEEASIIVVSDGENIVPLASSQDHKRVFDGDTGPNTGGMGAYSPAPVVTDEIFDSAVCRIIKPAINTMRKRGVPYKGVLYAGIMITEDGPKLLEFNVRFGDPETEAIMPRIESDLIGLLEGAIDGKLKGFRLKWRPESCVSVVMASGGYPGKYEKGKEITGIEEALKLKDVLVFHAGTRQEGGKIFTDGGRVLNVVALGKDIEAAIGKAYQACETIKFEGVHYRKDIGHRGLLRSRI